MNPAGVEAATTALIRNDTGTEREVVERVLVAYLGAANRPKRPMAEREPDEETLKAALAQIEQLPGRLHPIAGYQFDKDPRKIARAALAAWNAPPRWLEGKL